MYARPRLPDPVRTAAVRAVIIIALTLCQLVVMLLALLAGSWLVLPMAISTLLSAVVATWSVLDIWVTSQSWRQRNGVVSVPSSVARANARARRAERRAARKAARRQGRGAAPASGAGAEGAEGAEGAGDWDVLGLR
ncbi:hypothetical protein SAMN06297387_11450 [Streptomyces zhaozhouensis]|uniref:Uncharacterized protein n=1 Tax=Streptomyces zhaozhouensis TaxID=1300267 RepID=A0A286DZM5_9ACTN|nr:hypothetical protein [Streptomyces zhaozhouensis]SOD64070.1 hypothetical protein SAMN06297387_11450 [Streptomyces zhaozhouensis]